MVLTEQQRDEIVIDFIDIFKAHYGENWKLHLTRPLKPSPIQQIADLRGVCVSDVRKIRRQIFLIGELILWYTNITSD